jgi:glycosyltransferase involved in cell wall biosynthesis
MANSGNPFPNEKIAVIIPARNEEQAIGKVLAEIPNWVSEIIVVNNGSSDATVQRAIAGGARVVDESIPGYGAACLTGIDALTPETSVVVFLDGDYSDHPQEMASLVDPIAMGQVDFVVGSRMLGGAAPGSLMPVARFGNWLSTRLIRIFFGQTYTDLGPFRAIRHDVLVGLNMRDRNYGWTVEMQVKAAQQKIRSQEIGVRYRPRIGQSKISGTVRGSFFAGMKILTVIAREAGPWRTLLNSRSLNPLLKNSRTPYHPEKDYS